MNSKLKNWALGAFVAASVTGVALLVAGAFDADPVRVSTKAGAPAAAAEGCAASRFAVVTQSARAEAGRIVITGAVRNDNAKACGVRINVQVFDKGGQLRGVEQPWVASINNIGAGQQYAFDVILPAQLSKIASEGSYSIDAMEAREWVVKQ